MEKLNFKYAGQTLSEIWKQVSIDNFPTDAEYIVPEKSELEVESLIIKDQVWFQNHVRTSQYFLQIIKCCDLTCCQPIRSSYFEIIPRRFIPHQFQSVKLMRVLKHQMYLIQTHIDFHLFSVISL